jgi:hypothetical protein
MAEDLWPTCLISLAKSYQASANNNNGQESAASPGLALMTSLGAPQRSPRNSLAVPHKVQFVENKNLW